MSWSVPMKPLADSWKSGQSVFTLNLVPNIPSEVVSLPSFFLDFLIKFAFVNCLLPQQGLIAPPSPG